MNIEPLAPNVAVAGPTAPSCNQIDELIQLLVTIRHRWGNTAIKYRIQWGATALWAADDQKKEIERLNRYVERLKKQLKRLS